MTFSFTNYAAIRPQRSPFRDIVGDILGGYSGAVNAKYMPREKEAEIFHKQISPLAMLASSPYFSSLHPEQQQQCFVGGLDGIRCGRRRNRADPRNHSPD